MKHFDIARYEQRIKADPRYEGHALNNDEFLWESYTLNPEYLDEGYNKELVTGYTQVLEHKQENVKEVTEFDREGRQRETRQYFADYLETGVWRRYNIQGQVMQETDKDKPYPFSLRQVLDFARQKEADLRTTGQVKRGYDDTRKLYTWTLSWVVDKKDTTYEENYILDGTTGKVLQQQKKPAPGFIH